MTQDTTGNPRFADAAMAHPLFAGDVGALKRKLDSSTGLLQRYWTDFRENMLAGGETRAQMLHLATLVDDAGPLEESKGLLQTYWRRLAQDDNAGDVQFHTWCRCGSVLRRVVFFDWLAAKDAWSQAELDEAAESFLGFGFKHAFTVLTGRCRASNNQALSMALYCAVTGFIFGHKLADHATGRFLFSYGTGRLPDLVGLFPADGYGGEGSTYTSHVNTPLFYWTAEFLRQITGLDFLNEPFKPNGSTLRALIQMEMRLLSPGGLLAPWDHYGWQPEINASPFAYLARVTGDHRYLSLLPSLGLWEDPGMLAWGTDDPLWTLLWWPDDAGDHDDGELPGDLFGWFLPRTGAALDDPGRRTRLLQVWDPSADTIAGLGRAQVDPNHIVFEMGGEPLLQDGVPETDCDPWNHSADKVLALLSEEERERFIAYRTSIGAGEANLDSVVTGISPGLIGAANAIVIDDEPWYWPGERRVGRALFHARGSGLQAVSADAGAFYAPHYDVQQARRASVWTDAGFALVMDSLEAASPHTWTWQAYLRPAVTEGQDMVRVDLPGDRAAVIAWEPGCEVSLTPVEHFPKTQECRSVRLELRATGPAARFAVVIAPDYRAATVRRRSDHVVELTIDGQRHTVAAGNLERERLAVGDASSAAAFAWRRPDGTLTELDQGDIPEQRADVHELPDVDEDHDLQLSLFEDLVAWSSSPGSLSEKRGSTESRPPLVLSLPGNRAGELSRIDACLAQVAAETPDTTWLVAVLEDGNWPVQIAAAEVLGRRGCVQAAPALRDRLAAEHAIPHDALYPPEDEAADTPAEPDAAKRWRVKMALIVALGRLRDADAVPLLGQILADARDFYTVYGVAAQALGRIGGDAALEALAPALTESEHNTRVRTRYAVEAIHARGA